MVISGFPSQIAALQFEWALQNPHLTTHMTPDERLQQPTRGTGRRPATPRRSINSVLGNLHLLLRVPSFARWPLELRFFSRDVYAAFLKTQSKTVAALPPHIPIISDFPAVAQSMVVKPMHEDTTHPIHRLETDYSSLTDYVEKTIDMFERETYRDCGVCHENLSHGETPRNKVRDVMYVACKTSGCRTVSHVRCLSKRFLEEERKKNGDEDDGEGPLLPVAGTCPGCGADMKWVDAVKESTLRYRGPREVMTLLKRKQARERKAAKLAAATRKSRNGKISPSQVIPDTEDEEDEWSEEEIPEEEVDVQDVPDDEDREEGFIELDDEADIGSGKYMVEAIGQSNFEVGLIANGERKLEKLREKAGLPKEGRLKYADVVEIPDTEDEDEESSGEEQSGSGRSWKDAVELD